MGQDVFSQAEPLVIFSNRSWLTDRASYNSQTGEVKSLTGRGNFRGLCAVYQGYGQ